MNNTDFENMSNIVRHRVGVFETNGFLTSEAQVTALIKALLAIQNSDKFKSMDKVLSKQIIEKEQINLINNIHEMFTEGWRFLTYFKFYANTKNIETVKKKDSWKAINAINNRDTSKFSKLFASQPMTKRHYNKNKSKRKSDFKKSPKYPDNKKVDIKVIKRKNIES